MWHSISKGERRFYVPAPPQHDFRFFNLNMWVFKVIRVFLPSSFSNGFLVYFFNWFFIVWTLGLLLLWYCKGGWFYKIKKNYDFLEFLCFFIQKKKMWGNKKKSKNFFMSRNEKKFTKNNFFQTHLPLNLKFF